jgi:hypothetical protein
MILVFIPYKPAAETINHNQNILPFLAKIQLVKHYNLYIIPYFPIPYLPTPTLHLRQTYLHVCSCRRIAFKFKGSFVIAQDALGNEQPQPRAFAR